MYNKRNTFACKVFVKFGQTLHKSHYNCVNGIEFKSQIELNKDSMHVRLAKLFFISVRTDVFCCMDVFVFDYNKYFITNVHK